jgi:hypothetical protein
VQSNSVAVAKADGPAAPTTVDVVHTTNGESNGAITGVTPAMEYKLQGNAQYIPIEGSEITGLAAGTYLVRIAVHSAATLTHEAGTDAVVTINTSLGSTPIHISQITTAKIRAQAIGNSIMLENLPTNAKIELYSMQGKQIYSGNSGNSQILRILVQTKGLYIVKITYGSQKLIHRVAVKF